VVLDHDLKCRRIVFARLAMNGIDGTAHEAVGVQAGTARAGDEEVFKT
jgi:hypothetical protein